MAPGELAGVYHNHQADLLRRGVAVTERAGGFAEAEAYPHPVLRILPPGAFALTEPLSASGDRPICVKVYRTCWLSALGSLADRPLLEANSIEGEDRYGVGSGHSLKRTISPERALTG